MSKQYKNLREKSTADLLEVSFDLKCSFTRISTDFIRVKDELENELEKLEKKPNNNDSYLHYKDQQIERLIKFYNRTEQIINDYANLFQLLKIQNIIIEDALNGKIIKDENFRKEFLNLNY